MKNVAWSGIELGERRVVSAVFTAAARTEVCEVTPTGLIPVVKSDIWVECRKGQARLLIYLVRHCHENTGDTHRLNGRLNCHRVM